MNSGKTGKCGETPTEIKCGKKGEEGRKEGEHEIGGSRRVEKDVPDEG